MKYLQNAFEIYINSSIHVSLAVVAFALISFFDNGITPDLHLILFVFFASITGYNFVKYAGVAKLHHLSLAKNLRIIQVFSGLCFLALIYFSFYLNIEVLIATAILGLFTLFYAIPIFAGGKNLRSLPGLKIFIIAMVWAGATQILPIIHAERILGTEIIADFLQRLLIVIVITLPFEIRDVDFDNEDLGTIPQRLGITRTKIFGTVLIVLTVLIELFQQTFNPNTFLAMLIILFISGVVLWKAKESQHKYYSSFFVEAIPILYLGVYLVFTNVFAQIPF